eukprot:CAMPEP_0198474436 /NCGR_PEP_ID=MMETSP1456-20131121/40100_1 /TAXON_ID=1461544 ORGANISM="Unidentified sp., Strain RCC1871" /NCGR_SAMPLE_ID=MMETSP1456 /ASSEMBLY_ACC=CAM_ASM_001119 /LENGTH=143 /DNA_ID=CAMNT_0044201129 /DNA_START=17 /DNA_END=444 /DNA_ORIENTATION=+
MSCLPTLMRHPGIQLPTRTERNVEFECWVSHPSFAKLRDHVIMDKPLMPGAAFVDINAISLRMTCDSLYSTVAATLSTNFVMPYLFDTNDKGNSVLRSKLLMDTGKIILSSQQEDSVTGKARSYVHVQASSANLQGPTGNSTG